MVRFRSYFNKERMTRWGHSLGYAFMISLLFLVVLTVFSISYRAFVNPPPAKVFTLDKEVNFTYCPGFDLDIHLHIIVNKPVTLYVNTVVNDETGIVNIRDTESEATTLHYPIKANFNQTVAWQIPDLPAGKYKRVVSVRSLIDFTNPVFLILPFTIRSDCK